jgi:hypothetical protein
MTETRSRTAPATTVDRCAGTHRSTPRGVAREHRPTFDAHAPAPTCPAGDEVASAVASIVAADPRARRTDGEVAELADTLRAMDRLAARAVRLAREVDGRRAAAEEGMALDAALRLHTGAAPADVSMVLTTAEVLATMPASWHLFSAGVLSWGQVRALVLGARRLDPATRTQLDRHLGRCAEQLRSMDADRRGWAIDDALADHQPGSRAERQAEQRTEREFLALQGRLDGSGTIYGEFAPESFATVTDALQTEADAPRARPCPGDTDAPAEPIPTRGQQLAAALARLCDPGRRAGGGPVPVRFSVTVDVDRLSDTAAGQLAAGVRGRPPRIVRRALDRLACDAALDLVVRDGADLLAAQRYAPDVTAAVRRAVVARDAGCRFPACTAPASWCDVHHVRPRADGGDHAVGNLVLLCRRHHTTIHRRGWRQTLHEDGTYTIRRRGRTWTTLPRREAQLPPPRTTEPAGAGPAPPEAGRHGRTSRAGPTAPAPSAPSAPRSGDTRHLAPHELPF